MLNQEFKYLTLKLPEPDFGSPLTTLVLELEHLRKLQLQGSTHPPLFFQLKHIFHTLESIGSARIEGNNTTIAQFIETQLEERTYKNEQVEEIRNIEKTMHWVDNITSDHSINRSFVSELHKMIVQNLTPPPNGEGDHDPGEYRKEQVEITGSQHLPPPPYRIVELMDELFEFLEKEITAQFDLLRIAIAHHRFMWIHPFRNGNGRVGRLFTYAMLVKTGFKVDVGQILNPTAVFCIDREKYYKNLALADKGTKEGLENWCMYVLGGLHREIQKVDRLVHHKFVLEHLLNPALTYSHKMKYIDNEELGVLKIAAQKKIIQASDIRKLFKGMHSTTVSRKIKGLREKKMLEKVNSNSNKYQLSFINNFLIRGMINALGEEGYIPLNE
ncbi:MAG: Fic family protein [Balneolales bacterium]